MVTVTIPPRARQETQSARTQSASALLQMDDIADYALKVLRYKPKADKYLARAKDEVLEKGLLHDISTTSNSTEVTAKCKGSGQDYDVRVQTGSGSPETTCTCPSAEKDRVCKHILALLMWRARQQAADDADNQAEHVASPLQDVAPHTAGVAPERMAPSSNVAKAEPSRSTTAAKLQSSSGLQGEGHVNITAQAGAPPAAAPRRRLPASFLGKKPVAEEAPAGPGQGGHSPSRNAQQEPHLLSSSTAGPMDRALARARRTGPEELGGHVPNQATGHTGASPSPKQAHAASANTDLPNRDTQQEARSKKAGPRMRQTTLPVKKKGREPGQEADKPEVEQGRRKRPKALADDQLLPPIRCSARVMRQTPVEVLLQQACEYLASECGTAQDSQAPGETSWPTNKISSKPKQSASQDAPTGRPRQVDEAHVQAAGTSRTGPPVQQRVDTKDAGSPQGAPPMPVLLAAILAADTQVIGELSPRSEAARQEKLRKQGRIERARDSNLDLQGGGPSSAVPKQSAYRSSHAEECLAPRGGAAGGVGPSFSSGVAPMLPPAAPAVSLLDIILAGGEPTQSYPASQGSLQTPGTAVLNADRCEGALGTGGSIAGPPHVGNGSALDTRPPGLFGSQQDNGGTAVSSLVDGVGFGTFCAASDAGGSWTAGAASSGGAGANVPARPKLSLRERMRLLNQQD